MERQTRLQIPVTDHSTFLQLCLIIELSLSNISIALLLYHQLEGAHIGTGRNLCTPFSVNTYMNKENDKYGEVLAQTQCN